MGRAGKSANSVTSEHQDNRDRGRNKEQELNTLQMQARDQYAAQQTAMVTNGTTDTDGVIQQIRQQVAQNVSNVLEGQKAESNYIQKDQYSTEETAATDEANARTNKRLQSNVSSAVADVIGGREHEAIKIAFEEEARFQDSIKRNSASDRQNLNNKTEETEKVISNTLRQVNNLLDM